MIKRLRIRFIIASTLALAVVLLIILGGTNLMGYHKIIQEADSILTVLAENDGQFPRRSDMDAKQKMKIRRGKSPMPNPLGRHELSPETPFESRYFTVDFDTAGKITEVNLQKIASVDQETAAQCGQRVLASGRTGGFWGDFRFLVISSQQDSRIIFLDCSRNLAHFRSTLLSGIATAAGCLTAVLFLLILFSGRIVKPVSESYEKQRRFITDAGHELKTPLTVMGADLELAEMESGANEWTQDIRLQIRRLTGLTNDLITLSRMDEEQPLQCVTFPVSDVVEETVQSFQSLAACQEQSLSISVQPMLSMDGSEPDIRKLVCVLVDNAVKYAPHGGNISVTLEQADKHILLTVTNTVQNAISNQQAQQLFDRFYRADASRSTSGGYGLGLSIARSIVSGHKGTIQAIGGTDTLTVTATLPIKH